MGRRYRIILVHVMWMIAGIVLGATVALLWVKGLKPDWIEATGTWFGGVATVLTLLWAVQTFRADQAHRETERQRRHDESKEAQLNEERARVAEASRVSIALRGGAGYGHPGDQKMTSVHVDVHNDSSATVVVTEFSLNEPLVSRDAIHAPFRVAPHETWTRLIEIEDVAAEEQELSGRPLTRFDARMTYGVDGRIWHRTSLAAPPPVYWPRVETGSPNIADTLYRKSALYERDGTSFWA